MCNMVWEATALYIDLFCTYPHWYILYALDSTLMSIICLASFVLSGDLGQNRLPNTAILKQRAQ